MGKLTVKGQEYVLGAAFRDAAKYTTFYVGVGTSTGVTEISTSIGEPSDSAYVRKPITAAQFGAFVQNANSQTEISNTVDIVTNAWAANQATALSTIGIFSAATGGDLLAYSDILDDSGNPKTLTPIAGVAVRLPSGQIKLSLD